MQTAEECDRIVTDYVADQVARSIAGTIVRLNDVQVEFLNVERQQNGERLTLEGDIFFQIISPVRDHNFPEYVTTAFDSPSSRQAIAFTAVASNCPEFAGVTSADLVVETSDGDFAAVGDSGEGRNRSQAGIYAGLAAAIVACGILVGIFVYNRYRDRSVHSRLSEDIDVVYEDNTNEYASEIGVNTANEVSTLGDPIPVGVLGPTPADHSTQESNSLDYDFKRAYQDVPSISEVSGSQVDVESLGQIFMSTDDDTLGAEFGGEEVFEVSAPPGVLGLVLETNRFGVPTVNNIKPSSVLADQVNIGDRLLSVDDQDVTVMLASEVSRLIASKKQQPLRKFIFSRPSKFDSEDDSFFGSMSKSKESSSLGGFEQTENVYQLKAGRSQKLKGNVGEDPSIYTLESSQANKKQPFASSRGQSRSSSEERNATMLDDEEEESVFTMLNPHTITSTSDIHTIASNPNNTK